MHRYQLVCIGCQRHCAVGDLLRYGEALRLCNFPIYRGEIHKAVSVQTNRCFHAQDFQYALVDALLRELALLHGFEQSVIRAFKVGRNDDHIIAGLNRFHGLGG